VPRASLSLLHFFLHRTLTQTPDPNLNACLLQGILLRHVKQTHNSFLPRSSFSASFKTLSFMPNTRALATANPYKSSSKSPPTPATRRCSFRTLPSTPPLASTSATTSKTLVYHLAQPAAFINSPLGPTRQRRCGCCSVSHEGKDKRFAAASCPMKSRWPLDTPLTAACFFFKRVFVFGSRFRCCAHGLLCRASPLALSKRPLLQHSPMNPAVVLGNSICCSSSSSTDVCGGAPTIRTYNQHKR
jgi:hypothetical protein